MRRETLEQLMTARREGRLLVRALNVDSGEERLIDPSADTSPLGLAAAAAGRSDSGQHVTLCEHSWFLSAYHAPWEIVIVGAVHIAQALAALAAPAGYRVRVIDPRSVYATPERFPGVILRQEWPDEALAKQPLTSHSALVALAHDPKLDDAGLAMALRSPAFYVGALGSARTHARRLARLEAQGFMSEKLQNIRGPVGLSIGARSPAEIAVAILAELVKVRRTPNQNKKIAGVVLAAGKSTRMGQNKLALTLDGKPLVRHSVQAALSARLDPLIVVTGHEASAVHASLAGLPVTFAHNEAFAEGLSTSVRAGIKAVPPDCDGAMVLLGDMPDISAALIARVAGAFDPSRSRAICVATAKGRRGHPVLWGRQFFSEMEHLLGDAGARDLIARHENTLCEVEANNDTPLIDIDTPEEMASRAAQ
jgi:xanthine dehydrogenase accessory factor